MGYQILGLLLLVSMVIFLTYVIRHFDKIEIRSPLGEKMAKTVSRMEKLSFADFEKKQEYFRDIITKYSPALLSYIDNFKLDLPRDIIGSVILLQKNGLLKIENGIFVKHEKIENSEISRLEEYILNHVRHGKLVINEYEVKRIVCEEGLEKNVLKEESKYGNSKIRKIFSSSMFILFACTMGVAAFQEMFGITIRIPLIVFILFIIAVAIDMCQLLYIPKLREYRKKEPFFRTEKGEDVNQKLEGLKNYLKDYGNMKNKEAETIQIWEDYLIYAIIFHQNDIAIRKYISYIDVDTKEGGETNEYTRDN